MINYRKVEVTETQFEATSMVCNKCGSRYDMDDYCAMNNFTTIRCSYGYGSAKDMSVFLSHVCEKCMDEIYDTFVVPPQVGEESFVGAPATMPMECEDYDPPITSAPVAPGKEDTYASQEETTEES